MISPSAIYLLSIITSAACAWLLFRHYLRARLPILMISAFAFTMICLNNALVYLDIVMLPTVDLLALRLAVSFTAVIVLIVGFIWEIG